MRGQSARPRWAGGGILGAEWLRLSAAVPVPVAESADRLDGRAGPAVRAKLAAQPHDAVLDPVGSHAERVAPRQLKQLDRAEDLSAVLDERGEQPVLRRGQPDRLAVHDDLVRAEVHLHGPVVVDLGQRLSRRLPPPQQDLHASDELGVAERLGDVVVRAAAQAAHLIGFQAVRGQDEDGDIAQVTDPLEHGPAVHLGQRDVKDHQGRRGTVEGTQPFPPVGCRGHIEPVPAEHGLDAKPDVGVVLDHEYSLCHDGTATACSGSRTLKVVPRPSALSTVTRPPCISTSAFTMAKPRPVPGRPAILAFDPRTNALNRRFASSGGMPIPVSDTSIRQLSRAYFALTRTSPPALENLTALPIRLSRTWSSRRGSARARGPPPASRWTVTPDLAATATTLLTASAARPGMETKAGSSGSAPPSSRLSISRSSISRSSRSAFRSMMSRNRPPSAESPSDSPRSSSLNETIDVKGVRSS